MLSSALFMLLWMGIMFYIFVLILKKRLPRAYQVIKTITGLLKKNLWRKPTQKKGYLFTLFVYYLIFASLLTLTVLAEGRFFEALGIVGILWLPVPFSLKFIKRYKRRKQIKEQSHSFHKSKN